MREVKQNGTNIQLGVHKHWRTPKVVRVTIWQRAPQAKVSAFISSQVGEGREI
jgi:hypothetical protein